MNQRGFAIPSPTMIMAGIIIALSLSNVLFIHLYRTEVKDHAEYRAEVKATSEQADKENNAKLDAAGGNTAVVASLYAADADRIAGVYRSRLDGVRRELRDCQVGRQVAGTASGADEGTANERPVTGGSEATVQKLEADAALTTLQVFGLQKYIRGLCAAFGCE